MPLLVFSSWFRGLREAYVPTWPAPAPAFRHWVAIGLGSGLLLMMGIAAGSDQSIAHATGVFGIALVASLGVGLVTKVVSGRESHVYLRVALASALTVGGSCWALDLRVTSSLDMLVLGAGLAQALGRVGCLTVGCCHGRPHAWGVQYGNEHVAMGFPRSLTGVPIFPVQGIEAVVAACVVAVGSVVLASGAPAGTGVVVYVTGYGILRFGLEILRADTGRPTFGPLTEAQATILALLASLTAMQAAGGMPGFAWATGGLATALAATALVRAWRTDPHGAAAIWAPDHLGDVVQSLRTLLRTAQSEVKDAEPQDAPLVMQTTRGLFLSGGDLVSSDLAPNDRQPGAAVDADDLDMPAVHVAASMTGGLSPSAVRALARLIAAIVNPGARPVVRPGRHGVVHVFVPLLDASLVDPAPPTVQPDREAVVH